MEREQRRLAAIVAADVVGYSRLMGRDESGTVARLREHRKQRLEPIVARCGGRLVKLTGDGALSEFPSAVDALSAAIEFQQAVADANTNAPPDAAIVFRIGVHLGDLIVEGDDLYGDGVNIAARLEAQAPPGGVVLSRTVQEAVAGKLRATMHDLGELALKNIDRPVHAFRAEWIAGDWSLSDRAAPSPMEPAPMLELPDKPSIAVLPLQNMSGDPEQEYFADGIAEDIITELARFRSLFVTARNSTFSYKGRAVDVRTVARELGVRYVVEGSVRKAGDRVRVTAQLVDATTGNHLWAERYDRTLEDVFAIQEEVTRSIVMAVAPEVELAEMAHARDARPTGDAAQLTWRAQGLYIDAARRGQPAMMLEAAEAARRAVAMAPDSLHALSILFGIYRICHLFRWGPEPEKANDAAWSIVDRMLAIDPRDYRTLSCCGVMRVMRGEPERGIADLLRALEVNPNSVSTLIALGFFEAGAGQTQEAAAHARLAIRLSPRDLRIGTAQLALAMAGFVSRDYDEAMRWAELAIRTDPVAPIRRAIMIACCAQAGDVARAAQERAALDSFAPAFVASLFSGENRPFTRPQDMEHLLEGLRLAGMSP